MREETRDFIARELLIVATLLLLSLTLEGLAGFLGTRLPSGTTLRWLVFLRWILWAGRRVVARPEHHPYVKHLSRLAAACLIVIALMLLVRGFLGGGSTVGYLMMAVPLGMLAAFLLRIPLAALR
jgi:hypothetical protein